MDRNPPLPEPRSARSPIRATAALIAFVWLASFAGCSSPGPFMRRQTMMGALKSNVAQLESEKEHLSKQLADSQSENRRIQSELAAVEDQNNELATRLDDARSLISRQGPGDELSSVSDPLPPPRRATPARAQPKGRKTPFAQIPNERRSLDEPEVGAGADDEIELPKPKTRPPRRISDDQSRLDDASPWLPVAEGTGAKRRIK